jgi:hypothetical protein
MPAVAWAAKEMAAKTGTRRQSALPADCGKR